MGCPVCEGRVAGGGWRQGRGHRTPAEYFDVEPSSKRFDAEAQSPGVAAENGLSGPPTEDEPGLDALAGDGSPVLELKPGEANSW